MFFFHGNFLHGFDRDGARSPMHSVENNVSKFAGSSVGLRTLP